MNTILVNPTKDTTFTVEKNESKQFVLLLTKSNEITLDINLVGESAKTEIFGLVIGTGQEQIKLHTKQNHFAKNTNSNLLIKSVLNDSSVFDFSGLIRIDQNAQISDAYLRNENLLLSKNTHCTSKPYLEILANNVRCTHGATMGKIDEEQIFYLESKGLNQKQAKETIIEGFMADIYDKIADAKIQARLKAIIIENSYGKLS